MNPASPPETVDVIIVGGGAAGCVVAGRLARADPTLQICIIESGQDNKDVATSYLPASYLAHLAPNSTTASFYAETNPSPACADRNCIVPVGHALGGGSSINFMMYTRASSSDFDDWAQPGWGAKDLIPLARKTETYALLGQPGQDPKIHGSDGPLEVSYGGHQSRIGTEFIKSATENYDIPFVDDLQDFKTGHGITQWPKWISPNTGRRSDAATGFVHPVLATQTNLHVLTEHKTIRVLLDSSNTAIGVEYCQNPLAKTPFNPASPPKVAEVKVMKARKLVVVSAGAFGSPGVLERSGIGRKEVLRKAGVEVMVEVAGVGSSYQDRQLTMATYRCAPDEETLDDYLRGVPEVHAAAGETFVKNGKGIIATNGIDAGMKIRFTPAEVAQMSPAMQKVWHEYFERAPDKPVMFGGVISGFLGDHSLVPPGKYMMAGGYLEYPMSRGYVHIRSSDVFAPPAFSAGFLTHKADMAPQVWTYKKLREILRRMPTYRGELAAVHPKFSATSPARCVDIPVEQYVPYKEGDKLEDIVYSEEDDAAIEQWFRENVATTWHSCATCPMKAQKDGGVVDARLDVYGTHKLKVADLSIIPSNVGSNTYSVALTVGEKAAVLIGEELGIAV